MKSFIRVAGMAVLVMQAWALPSAQAAEKLVVGVAIPTATHSFTSGIVWWANQAKAELEKAHPGLKIIVKTAATAPEQANQLQDMLTVNKINTLVIFPIESASLTQPVAQVKTRASTSPWSTVA